MLDPEILKFPHPMDIEIKHLRLNIQILKPNESSLLFYLPPTNSLDPLGISLMASTELL